MSSKRVREKLREMRIARDIAVDESRREREKNTALDGMTKAQLIEYAEEHGIEVDRAAKKAEIKETINKE